MSNKTTQKYLFSYFHDNSWWSLEIPAYNKDDAVDRIKKLPLAKYDGEIVLTVKKVSPIIQKFLSLFISRP